jgi:glutathione S-transferase
MNPLLGQPVFQAYAVASALLVLGLHAVAWATGHVRSGRKTVLNREDTKVYKGASVVDLEHADVQRAKRVHLNLIENALPFFVIGFVYTLTDPSLVMARLLFFGFVALRLLHALFYMKAIQPARAMSFFGGMLVNLVMVAQVLRAVLL